MGLRVGVLRLTLVIIAICATFYTFNVYKEVIEKWKNNSVEVKSEISNQQNNDDVKQPGVKEPHLPAADLPEVAAPKYACEMKIRCDQTKEIPFQMVSGAATIIGPSICVNGKWLMSNSIGNVNRGMNVAVVNGRSGEKSKVEVFDLYGEESGSFKTFMKNLAEDELVFMATFDDATQRLDKEARGALADLGSEHAAKLAFRDNWIFVGGKTLKHHQDLERHIVSDKEKNKFGNWPATVTLEGCLPKLT